MLNAPNQTAIDFNCEASCVTWNACAYLNIPILILNFVLVISKWLGFDWTHNWMCVNSEYHFWCHYIHWFQNEMFHIWNLYRFIIFYQLILLSILSSFFGRCWLYFNIIETDWGSILWIVRPILCQMHEMILYWNLNTTKLTTA